MPTQQQQINYGNSANDGQGDPLRSAFIKTDDNFDAIWAAGPVGSNVTILNTTIATVSTNGNLILKPNGIGIVQANSHILPNTANIRDLGSSTQRWRTAYSQSVNSVNLTASGEVILPPVSDITIPGGTNGYVLQTDGAGNLSWTAQGGAGNGNPGGANTEIQFNDAGTFGGDADLTYNKNTNVLNLNGTLTALDATVYGAMAAVTMSASGNATANYFIGNGSQLTGITAGAGGANTQIQFNDAGDLSGNASFTFNRVTGNVNLAGLEFGNQFISGTVPNGNITFHPDQSGQVVIQGASNALLHVVADEPNFQSRVRIETYGNTNVVGGGEFQGRWTRGTPDAPLPTLNDDKLAQFGGQGFADNAYSTGSRAYITIDAAGNWNNSSQGAHISFHTTHVDSVVPAEHLRLTSGGNLVLFDGNLFVSNGMARFGTGLLSAGNILPTANGVYSLGNAATYWSNLWVANNVTANYFVGNGSQLTGITASANTGNVTFNDQIVIGTGSNDGGGGLYLAPGPASIANSAVQYLRVRGGDYPTHIHLDTGNNAYYDQYFGADSRFVKLEANGNVVINADDYTGNGASWTFGTDGSLTLPNADATGFGNIYFEENSSTITFGLDDNTIPFLYSFSTSGITLPRGGATIRDTVGNAVAFGRDAAATGPQGNAAIAIGQQAGDTSQGASSVAIGYKAGLNTQGDNSVAIGTQAGQITQGQFAVAIGDNAGNNAQGTDAVAIGASAGLTAQGNGAVAIGPATATTSQGDNAVAIGDSAGEVSQGEITVAIGYLAGQTIQGNAAVAVGAGAGTNTQGLHAVAIGTDAGATTQGNRAVAIGYLAGSIAQGNSAVAIGYYAGELNQGNNSIIINATGVDLQQTTANTFTVAPVRNDVANTAEVMFYNTTSKEITYGNTISVVGNITSGNLTVGSGTITGGNVNGATFNGNVAFGTGTVGGSGNITGGNISAIGNVAAGNISAVGNIIGNTAGFAIGYRDIPQVSLAANVTTALSDAGKHYYSTSASNLALTIANNSSVSWAVGTAISIVNRGTANITVVQGSGVSLYLAGNATAANRTVTTYGMATVLNVAANVWMINGTGLS